MVFLQKFSYQRKYIFLCHRKTVKIVIVSIVSLEGVRSIDASRGKLRSVFFPEDGGNSCKIIAFCRSFHFSTETY